MELGYFIRGMVIGFSIAAPVGPIGILCIQRTLNQGAFYGFISGLGAATADGCYGLIAAFSLTAALGIAKALAAMHEAGMVHALVHPGNVLINTADAWDSNDTSGTGDDGPVIGSHSRQAVGCASAYRGVAAAGL